MKAKDIADCSMFGIPVVPFILGVLWFEGMIWIAQQCLIASSQLNKEEWADE